ncbi:hypothetical protein OHA25_07995 [Nonomuraea sp. NBC_00507]
MAHQLWVCPSRQWRKTGRHRPGCRVESYSAWRSRAAGVSV